MTSLAITFKDTYSSEYKLFEVDANLEELLLNQIGNVVHLKGASDQSSSSSTSSETTDASTTSSRAGSVVNGGHVVLCSTNKTQKVRCSETSNLILLVDAQLSNQKATPLKSANAVGSTQRTFVLSSTSPRLDHLDAALDEYVYVPPLSTTASSSTASSSSSTSSTTTTSQTQTIGVTMEILSQRVQASKEEILTGLETNNIPLVPNTSPKRWCKLNPDYIRECFDSILSVIETRSTEWDPTSTVPVEAVVATLQDTYASWIIEHILRSFSMQGCTDTSKVIGLNIQATRMFRAEQVLVESSSNGSSTSSTITELAREWSTRLPKGIEVEDAEKNNTFVALVKFEGLGLINGDHIHTFFRRNLANVPLVRFQQLFQERTEWQKEDLLRYLIGLEGEGVTLLVKWARAGNGGTTFTKR